MTLEEFIKKLKVALADKDTAEGLKSFGIEPDQIEGFEDLTIPTTLDEALKIKGVQSEFDKRLAKAADTREAKLKLKYGFGKEEEEEKNTEEEEEIDVKDPAMKAVLAQMKKMSEKLEAFENEKKQETLEQKRSRAMDYLKSKGILPVYVHEMDLEKDFEEQFDTVKKKFEDDGGTLTTQKKSGTSGRLPNPTNPGAKNEPSKEEVEAFKKVF